MRLSKQLSGKRSGEPGYDDAVPGHAAKVAAAVINGMLASSRSSGKGAGAGCGDAQLNDEGTVALAAEGAIAQNALCFAHIGGKLLLLQQLPFQRDSSSGWVVAAACILLSLSLTAGLLSACRCHRA